MDNNEKIILDKRIVIGSILVLVLLIFGISYAYFMAQDTSAEQLITTANLGITFDDETAIVAADDIKPILITDVPTKATRKKFTLVKKAGSEDIYTKIELTNIETSEELAEYDLKWALYKGTADAVTAGTAEKIATGDFGGKTSGSIVLATNQLISSTAVEYNLYIWINETNLDQSEMMGQSLSATIYASGTDVMENTLSSLLLGQNNINVTNVSPTFSESSTDNGLFVQEGDTLKSEMGFPTYYYRGAVTNNYVNFANQIWRIVRINEDGSIRIISEDKIASVPYNPNGDSLNDYTSKYVNANKDEGESNTIKDVVEEWYNTNIGNNNTLNNKVVKSSFCNDISGLDDTDVYKQGTAANRMTNLNPSFVCPSGSNKAYEKIGLITADEALYAGTLIFKTVADNPSYLTTGHDTWTMTPKAIQELYFLYSSSKFLFNSTNTTTQSDVRAVINLSADVTVTSGDGLSVDSAYTIE